MPALRLSNLLEESLNRAGIYHQVTAAQTIKECLIVIQKKWGRQSLDRISPKYVKNGILTIQVKDTVYLAELRLKEIEVINEINKKFKKAAVKGLRFLIR